MNQTTTDTRDTRPADTRHAEDHLDTEGTILARAIAAFVFSDLTVRHCGHGLPPTLPYKQDDWTLTEISKSVLRRYSIIDREILSRLEILDKYQIPYDHIYIGHQDKKPFEIPPKVVSAVKSTLPVLAGVTVAILTLLGAVAVFTAQAAATVMVVDPVVIVAIKEHDNSYQLLEISKWYS